MIFELAGEGAFDGPVTGIVYAGGHFISEQAAVQLEKFDGEYADVLQFVEDAVDGCFRGALDGGIESRSGSKREAQDTAAMMIFDEGIDGGFAGAGADGQDAELAREIHEAFENEWDFAFFVATSCRARICSREFVLGAGDILGSSQKPL